MQQQNYQDLTRQNLEKMPIEQLRKHWLSAWKLKPHKYIGKKMLIAALLYKIREANGDGMNYEQKEKLDHLVKAYKRNKSVGAVRQLQIKSGTQLVKEWKGKRHAVIVKSGFFEYEGKKYSSLSAIASHITGTRWNGWTFFGVKNPRAIKETV